MTQPSGEEPGPAPDMVDWGLALATAQRLTKPGPQLDRAEVEEVVADLRACAAQAERHVREHTGLHAEGGTAPVLVVDRIGWCKANLEGLRIVVQPLVDKIHRTRPKALTGAAAVVGPRITGVETGALLSFLASKVLGQFDPFWTAVPGAAADDATATGPGGRLLLVAPNTVEVQRQLGVDAHDFRLWVCLHEETHRVQFSAVPWMREHVRREIAAFVEATDVDPAVLVDRLRQVVEAVVGAARGEPADSSLVELVQTPAQREVFDRLTAVMSLLEGHAEVVMDGVGPDVVPSVVVIRERFQARRGGTSSVDRLVRRLLGLDAKMRQYRDGAAFVRHVISAVGMAGFNQVWESPRSLPTLAEIGDPGAWVRRVHGNAALEA